MRDQQQRPPSESAFKISPFLRWAGGKRQLIKTLLKCLPTDIAKHHYREPFLGGGCLFFALRPPTAILSDANEHLMKCYEFVRDQPNLVGHYLRSHASRNTEAHYYRVRAEYNRSPFSAAQAARFIYLNKTCFNGIFRVNTRGEFNVPYGWKKNPSIASQTDLLDAAALLKNASIHTCSFEKALEHAVAGDFIYLDPPYPPLNGTTANFTHYTMNRFKESDQRTLAELFRHLDARSCKILMTNADTPLIRRLYKGFQLASLPVTRFISCKPRKHKVQELLISSYRLDI